MRNVVVAAVAATLTLGAVCLTACAPAQPEAPADPVEESVGGGRVDGLENNVNEK